MTTTTTINATPVYPSQQLLQQSQRNRVIPIPEVALKRVNIYFSTDSTSPAGATIAATAAAADDGEANKLHYFPSETKKPKREL